MGESKARATHWTMMRSKIPVSKWGQSISVAQKSRVRDVGAKRPNAYPGCNGNTETKAHASSGRTLLAPVVPTSHDAVLEKDVQLLWHRRKFRIDVNKSISRSARRSIMSSSFVFQIFGPKYRRNSA